MKMPEALKGFVAYLNTRQNQIMASRHNDPQRLTAIAMYYWDSVEKTGEPPVTEWEELTEEQRLVFLVGKSV